MTSQRRKQKGLPFTIASPEPSLGSRGPSTTTMSPCYGERRGDEQTVGAKPSLSVAAVSGRTGGHWECISVNGWHSCDLWTGRELWIGDIHSYNWDDADDNDNYNNQIVG